MREVPDALRVVGIEGHTDNQGERGKNYLLARDRVRSVFDHLTKSSKWQAIVCRFAGSAPIVRWPTMPPRLERPRIEESNSVQSAQNRRRFRLGSCSGATTLDALLLARVFSCQNNVRVAGDATLRKLCAGCNNALDSVGLTCDGVRRTHSECGLR
jgi:hypothetical protein